MEYLIHLGILIAIYLILAQGFNLVFGLGQLFNLAHVATYAIGAYTTALLTVEYEWSVWTALPASVLLGSAFSLLIGAISVRLSNDYFAIGTLAFSSVVTAVLINWRDVTRGVLGIPGIMRPRIGQYALDDNLPFFIFSAVISSLVLLLFFFLFNSSFARSLRAQAQFEPAAQSIGLHTTQLRLIAFAIASATSALAGGLFAYYLSYIDPSSFMLNEMVLILTICIAGGPGSYAGVCLSTFALLLLPESLRFCEFPPGILGPMRQLIYALILFLVMYTRRARLFPVRRSI